MDIPSGIPAPNFIPNVEELAATNPDLVVQWPEYGANIVEPITNAGLRPCSFPAGTEQKARDYQAMVATAMGKPEGTERSSS
ncbi:hypothetical protein [Rhizobium sp. P44RR-XXIV]|uniref:hypothetical protein n=1 Tax=Rhizobium sp. P44RR-XXIV TaxID=1921145 RepID=UPI00098593AE|nr:hypothetical protein [Rhizobium sp. P44RR-XXIV]TIX90679.1 hypothetical protein BSK43_015580 [Rhizobium sp. P44RR-XXIV]